MNNFHVQKFFKRCVFTWIISSTLGSKCILAANNFSLITIFFFRVLLSTAKLSFVSFRFFSFRFDLSTKANYSGNQHSNFLISSERNRASNDHYTIGCRCVHTESNKGKSIMFTERYSRVERKHFIAFIK